MKLTRNHTKILLAVTLAVIGYDFRSFEISEYLKSITKEYDTRALTVNRNVSTTAAVCAVTRGSERYIEEWIDYNLALGFHSIYLYDTSDNFTLKEISEKIRNRGIQNTYIKHAKIVQQRSVQRTLYAECAETYGENHTYLAFFDDDEFLVLKEHPDVVSMLRDYLHSGSLYIHWRVFGTSNHTHYEPVPVTKRFVYREKELDAIPKSIVKVSDLVQPDIHYHETKEGTPLQSVNGDVAVFHHYKYKSEQEFKTKMCERGGINKAMSQCTKEILAKAFHGDVYDDSAWEFLKSKVPKYRVYDELEDD